MFTSCSIISIDNSIGLKLVGSILECFPSLGLAFIHSSLACLSSLVSCVLSSIGSILGSILSSTNGIVNCTFYSILCLIESVLGVIESIRCSIFCTAGNSLNLFKDSGQRSNVNVEVLQSFSIILNEGLNLGCILREFLNITLTGKFVQLLLNGCDCSGNGGGIACLYLICESVYDRFWSGFLEVESFLGCFCFSASTENHCSCKSCHCK